MSHCRWKSATREGKLRRMTVMRAARASEFDLASHAWSPTTPCSAQQ